MNYKFSFLLLFASLCMPPLYSQTEMTDIRSLSYYVNAARQNSPLIQDYLNQKDIQTYEAQRLKALYAHSRLELNGDALFVPIISRDNGKTSFLWNAQSATDYYGYDLGENSGNIHAYVSWIQPLLGGKSYKETLRQTEIKRDMLDNQLMLEQHQLEYSITRQYILCLQDTKQIAYADSMNIIIDRQYNIVEQLAKQGLVKQSDLRLLSIEQKSNEELRATSLQSYKTHLSELNILCGLKDNPLVSLENIVLSPNASITTHSTSLFMERYKLDSLNTMATLKVSNLQYRPQLNLFVNSGFSSGRYTDIYRHFGASVGLAFSWTLFDGKQKHIKEKQAIVQLNTIAGYRNDFYNQREQRKRQYLDELRTFENREKLLRVQIDEYTVVLDAYKKEMEKGQLSIIDYINVLRSKLQTDKEYMLLQTNSQLLIAALNYWNW